MLIERIGDIQCKLGEGPVWDVPEQALYFVDSIGRRLWRHDPESGDFRSWETPALAGSLALREGGGAVLALGNGFHLFDLETGAATLIGDPEAHLPITQFNDGKVDRRGRFLAGTVATDMKSPVCGLYRLDADLSVSQLDQGFVITNGPCWSPDGGTFYFADSIPFAIYAYDYDQETGAVANRRLFADTRELGGIPDGATVDRDGRIWTAICGGGKVACYLPDGRLDRVIEVPPRLASSVMFGGPALDRLFLTSIDGASMGFESDPAGGQLFVIDGLGATGLPEPRFAG